MKRQQSQSIIQVPNQGKVWRLKVFISHHPYQARNGKMTGGTGSQKLSDIILRKKSTVSEVMFANQKVPEAMSWFKKFPEANFGQ